MQKYISCYAGLIEDNKMYIPNKVYALLLEYDLKSWNRRCLMDLSNIFLDKQMLALGIFKEGEYIYLVLRNTFRILECNLRTGQSAFIGEQPLLAESEEIIFNALRIGNEIWSIPGFVKDNIQIFNIEKKTFEELSVSEYFGGKENELLFSECCGVLEDSVYLAVFGSNSIVQVLYRERKIKIWQLAADVFLQSIFSCKGEIWFSDFRNPAFPELCRWEREGGCVETFRLERCDWNPRHSPWEYTLIREVAAYENKLIVIPHFSNEIIIIDRVEKSQRRLEYPDDFQRVAIEGEDMFRGISVQKEQVFLFPCAYNGLLILNMDTEELEFHEMRLDKEDCKAYYQMHYQKKREEEAVFFEGEFLSYERGEFLLPDYIEQIETNIKPVQFEEKDIRSGKRIYDFLTGWKE